MTDVQAGVEAELGLPAGLHPNDYSWPPHDFSPHPGDRAHPAYGTGKEPFAVENAHALPIYQRAAKTWKGSTYLVPATAGSSLQIAGQLVGRVSVTIFVPASSAGSVLLNSDRGLVDAGQGITLPAGGSVTISSEDSVYGLGVG